MHTARKRQNIAAGNATSMQGGINRENANIVALPSMGGGFVLSIINGHTMRSEKTNGAQNEGLHIGLASWYCLKNWEASASSAASLIRAFSTSTILIPRKRTSRHIAATRRLFVWPCGKRKWIISNSFVPTAIALKLTSRPGERQNFCPGIACKRIEDAYKQGDLFVEPPAKPIQQGMDL